MGQQRDRGRPLPLVEVRHHRLALQAVIDRTQQIRQRVSVEDALVGFRIVVLRLDAEILPQEVLHLADVFGPATVVQQQHLRTPGDEPSTGVHIDALVADIFDGLRNRAFDRRGFKLDSRRRFAVGPRQPIAIAPMMDCSRRFTAQDGVNTASLATDFPRRLEQQGFGRHRQAPVNSEQKTRGSHDPPDANSTPRQ